VTPLAWALALAVTFVAAALQGIVGLGFAMLSVPILSLIDPRLAPVPQLLITVPLTVSMAWRERRHLEIAGVGWIVAGRIPGAVIGIALLAVAVGRALDIAIAVVVLVAVAIIASGRHVSRNPGTEFGAGVASGISGLVASIGGPPLALLYTDAEGPTVRSSLAAVFTIGLAITITARVATGNITMDDVVIAAILLPALLLGYLVSIRLKGRVRQPQIRLGLLVLSAVGAVGLMVRAMV
jgi:uncharacterized membrane protein YfcA